MSNQEALGQLTYRLLNDAEFREQMRQDPEGAAERAGYQLDDEDLQALKSVDWSQSDEQLQDRVSKAFSARWC